MKELKRLDFLDQLMNYINTLGLYERVTAGIVGDGEAIAINMQPSGQEVVYMDGERDKQQNIQLAAKSTNHQKAMDTLNIAYRRLETVADIPSANGSYEFKGINITSYPALILHDENGNFIYELTFTASITIYEGVA